MPSGLLCCFSHTPNIAPSDRAVVCACDQPCRGEALAIGNIYTELLGEFGRFVGGSLTAVNTLKKGVLVNPLALGVSHLEHSLQSLITFLDVSNTASGVQGNV